MNITRETKKAEAIKRMKALGLFEPCIKAFKDRDEVQLSEPTGGLYEFHDNEKLNSIIKRIEQQFNCLIYHVVHSYTNLGEMYSCMMVSDYEEEWEWEMEDINDGNDGIVFCWVENVDIPEYSEMGSIIVKNRFGGLVRIY